jgi:hypothetical protein
MEKPLSIDVLLQRIKDSYEKQSAAMDGVLSTFEERFRVYKAATKEELVLTFMEQNGFHIPERKAETAALELYDALSSLPEFRPVVVEVPDIEEDEEQPLLPALDLPAPPEWETLQQITKEKPVAMFGGYVLDEKLRWISEAGVNTVWVSNEAGSRAATAIQRFCARIRNNAFCAVIVLEELMSHQESAMILSACRASNTLYAMGKKGGRGRMRIIFTEFNRRMKGEAR